VSASDAAEEAGIMLPRVGEKTAKKLKKLLAPVAVPSNPLDMTPQTPKENYQGIVSAIMSDKEIGGVLAINVGLDHREFADAFVKCRRLGKPILAFTSATPKIDAVFRQNGIPLFRTPERAVRAYRALAEYGWMKSGRLR
jgi:acyl-CoA synthetase (NDP forming)